MATASDVCIAEVEEIVEAGEIAPERVDVAGIYVHRLIKGPTYEKRIERRTVRGGESKSSSNKDEGALKREKIAKRAALEFKDGMYCNLGKSSSPSLYIFLLLYLLFNLLLSSIFLSMSFSSFLFPSLSSIFPSVSSHLSFLHLLTFFFPRNWNPHTC